MKTIALVRCSGIRAQELALMNQLRQVFPGAVFPVVDNMGHQFPSLPEGAIPISPEFIAEAGLRIFAGVGWQCGDYAYYAARAALPDFDRAWLIEPDVGFTFARLADFFDMFRDNEADYLVPGYHTSGEWWMWHKTVAPLVGDDDVRSGAFPITRMSSAAIDFLAAERARHFADLPPDVDRWMIPNDEAFAASLLTHAGFDVRDMALIAPEGTFEQATFNSITMIMPEELRNPSMANRVVHSVRTREAGLSKMRHIRAHNPDVWAIMHQRVTANLGEEAWLRWTEAARQP